MSFTELKNEAAQLPSTEQRKLIAFLVALQTDREDHECSEDDSQLLAALDEAIARAGAVPTGGCSGDEVRSRMTKWISK
jgi:hypothetical protein